jgi:quercetin dioxygenase-like cupin family protein
MNLSTPQLSELAARLAERHERWDELLAPDPRRRVYEQVWDATDVNAWLICWSHGHDTGWHDHDDAAAAIVVLSGQVREQRLRLAERPRTQFLRPGSTYYVPPSTIHRVAHAGASEAVTLHCYSPPLRRTGSYSVDATGELQRAAQSFDQELRPPAPTLL